jgi:hypothetical protein
VAAADDKEEEDEDEEVKTDERKWLRQQSKTSML